MPRRGAVPGVFFILWLFMRPSFTIAVSVLPLRKKECRIKFARKPSDMARGEEIHTMNLLRLFWLGVAFRAVARSAPAETISVSATKWLASAAIFVADDRGFFR